MATHMQHEDSFIDEMVRFVQPTSDTTGMVILLRLSDGNFVHQQVELSERMFRNDPAAFDNTMHTVLTEILEVARKGPGGLLVDLDGSL